MKINKDDSFAFNPVEFWYVLLGKSIVNHPNYINPPPLSILNKKELIAYLYGQNEALRAKLNEIKGAKDNDEETETRNR